MSIITTDQVKELLGIGVADYDAQIAAKIPYIESIVKLATRNNWNKEILVDMDSTIYLEISQEDEDEILPGAQVSGDGIPAGAYIVDIYPGGDPTSSLNGNPVIQISSAATKTQNSVRFFLGFPIGFLDIVANGIWYKINQTSTVLPSRSIASRAMKHTSVSYNGKDSEIDGRFGMPSWFIKGLPRYHRGV